jgi:hypothetical protein
MFLDKDKTINNVQKHNICIQNTIVIKEYKFNFFNIL